MTTFDPSMWRIPSSDLEWFFDDSSPEFQTIWHEISANTSWWGNLLKKFYEDAILPESHVFVSTSRNVGKSLHSPPSAVDLRQGSISHGPYRHVFVPGGAVPPYFTIVDEVGTWQASLTEEEPPVRTCRRHGRDVLGSGLCPVCRREQVLSTGAGSSSRTGSTGRRSGGKSRARKGSRSSGRRG